MLIDEFLPEYEFSERHQIEVRASRHSIFPLIKQLDVSSSVLARTLFFLRGLGSKRTMPVTIESATKSGFILLGERDSEEILLGIVGKFWTLGGCVQQLHAREFRDYHSQGFAKAVWNFSLSEKTDATTVVATETRIHCLDSKSRRWFRLYWIFVRPFSGIIRNQMLKLLRRSAE